MKTTREVTKTMKGATEMGLKVECTIYESNDDDATVSLTIKHEGTNYGIQIDGIEELNQIVDHLLECRSAAEFCI
jgi:ribosome maturation factor RimP